MADDTPVYPRKPGRPKSGLTVKKITVMLPPYLHAWAGQHPEGLSGLVRRLLQAEYAASQGKGG